MHVCLECVSPRSLNQDVQEEEGVASDLSKMRMDIVKTSSALSIHQLAPGTGVIQSSSMESTLSSSSSKQQLQGKESGNQYFWLLVYAVNHKAKRSTFYVLNFVLDVTHNNHYYVLRHYNIM